MPQTIIKLDQVCKTYHLEDIVIPAVNKIDLEIKEGDFTAIVGTSGSGKSTLLHLIGLLDKQTSGRIQFLDKDVTDYAESELAKLRNQYIGFIFQMFNLLPRTSALDNVLLPTVYGNHDPKAKRRKAVELLTMLGLEDRQHNLSNQLSGGQQQRVAIARALINDPKVIYADEPTGNLDSKSGREVFQILKKLNKEGRTVVIVTHDASLAKQAKKQIRLMDGKIVKKN